MNPIITASQLLKLTFSFNSQGDSTIVINGEANSIIVASAIGNLESDTKKKYVISNKDIERKT